MNESIQQIVQDRITKRNAFEEQVETILTFTSPDDVMEQIIIRSEFRADNDRLVNKIKDKQAELDKMLREIRQVNRETRLQEEKLDKCRWSLINTRKLTNA